MYYKLTGKDTLIYSNSKAKIQREYLKLLQSDDTATISEVNDIRSDIENDVEEHHKKLVKEKTCVELKKEILDLHDKMMNDRK